MHGRFGGDGMSEKDYENVLKHLAPADLHQQFDKTADAFEKITKMYFDMKAKNEALMEALKEKEAEQERKTEAYFQEMNHFIKETRKHGHRCCAYIMPDIITAGEVLKRLDASDLFSIWYEEFDKSFRIETRHLSVIAEVVQGDK